MPPLFINMPIRPSLSKKSKSLKKFLGFAFAPRASVVPPTLLYIEAAVIASASEAIS